MKIVLAFFFMIPFCVLAQNVSFVTESDSTYATIQGYGGKDFITSEGYISYSTVIRAYYHSNELDNYLSKKMETLNIPLHKAGERIVKEQLEIDKKIDGEDPVAIDAISNAQLEDLESRIQKFREKRNTGFTVQGVGIGVSVLGVGTGSAELLVIGTVLNAIGWIINWVSGDELKRNRY